MASSRPGAGAPILPTSNSCRSSSQVRNRQQSFKCIGMSITPRSDESRSGYNAEPALARMQSCPTRVTGSTGGTLVVLFGFIALLGAQLVLVLTIPGTNYDGADGQAAQ